MSERGSTAVLTNAWTPVALLGLIGAVLAHQIAAGPAPFDAGELAAASWALGGSHPPGQPLHAIVARFFAWLPLGPLPARMALCSVAGSLVAAALAMRATRELLRLLDVDEPRLVAAAALAAGSGTVLAEPVLRQALRVEVYSLALALVLYAIASLLAWLGRDGARSLWRAAFAGGLAAATHPPHGAAIALVALALVVARGDIHAFGRRSVLGAIAFGVAGLGVYGYLPARAAAGAATWGEPLRVAGLWEYLSAKAYWQNNLANPQGSLSREIYDYGRHLVLATSVAPLLGALSLPLRCAPERARVAWGVLGATALALFAACLQPFESKNPDNVAWLGPAVALLVVTGASGFAVIATGRPRWLGLFGLAVAGLCPASTMRLSETLRIDLPALESLAGSLVDTPPPRALVVATTDFAAASWMLAQAADGARPDVALFFPGLATSSWHWNSLAKHPALDGRPRRGPGASAHERYLRGLLDEAAPRIPIAAERELPLVGATRLAGPYLLFGALGPAPEHGSIGDRVAPGIEPERSMPRRGDADLGAAILRDYETTRARRLLASGRTAQAFAAFARAAWALPPSERTAIAGARGSVRRPTPPPVMDPEAFLVSAEDVARIAAVHAWSLGEGEPTGTLLEAQTLRGDARALLQIAWVRLFEGNRPEAKRALEAFFEHAPHLAKEASALRAVLDRDG